MLICDDGPARHEGFFCRRAPRYVRVVKHAMTGRWDMLDQLEDEPEPDEIVHVYRRDGGVGVMFACGRGSGVTGRWPAARYRWMPEVVGEEVRDIASWRAWCQGRSGAAK